ncbi:MAG: MFS transporter [Chloroflexi bacterium SZAS-1]|nr:MFS transporter [Chloroflexi bacterium SZAS-1]
MSKQQQPALLPQPPAVMRRNYRLGVLNGVLFTLGESMLSANLVLALLVRQLGGSLALVGLLPALQSGGYLLPQMLVGGRIQGMRAKLPLYRRAALARVIAYLVLLAAIFGANHFSSPVSLWLIIISFSIFNFGGGTSTLAFQDVVAKVIPPWRRGSFFGTRQLFGGLLSFLIVGPLVRWLLNDDSPLAFPQNYGALGTLGLVCIGGGLLAFALISEPVQAQPGVRLRVIDGLRRAPVILRTNANYRWFIISRMLTRVGQIAEPFYMIYATEVLRLPASAAGLYLALRAITGALSNLLWGRVSDAGNNRRLVLISGVLIVLLPVLVLAGPALVLGLGLGSGGMLLAIGLVFLVSGAANDGSNLAASTYLLEIAPDDERPTYMGLANTLLGLAMFVPVLGGWLVDLVGYRGIFALGLVFALLGLAASAQLGRAARPAPEQQQAALGS